MAVLSPDEGAKVAVGGADDGVAEGVGAAIEGVGAAAPKAGSKARIVTTHRRTGSTAHTCPVATPSASGTPSASSTR